MNGPRKRGGYTASDQTSAFKNDADVPSKLKVRWVATALVFALALFAAIYGYGVSTPAYEAVRKWVTQSNEVDRRVGTVERVSLVEFEEKAFDGRATYMVEVQGRGGTITIRLILQKVGGEWKIVGSSIE